MGPLVLLSADQLIIKYFQYHHSVKQFGSRSCAVGLIWAQTVCIGYQQMTLEGRVNKKNPQCLMKSAMYVWL